jgi:hypothetical protein
MDQIYQRAKAFLFGRRTYEIFAGSWGTRDDPGDSPIWTALTTKLKYVASTTLTDSRWANTTVLCGCACRQQRRSGCAPKAQESQKSRRLWRPTRPEIVCMTRSCGRAAFGPRVDPHTLSGARNSRQRVALQ